MTGPPPPERILRLNLRAWDAALSAESGNGRALPADVTWLLSNWSLHDPQTASTCRQVMAVLPADVRQAVTRLAGEHDPVTPRIDTGTSHEAASGAADRWLTVAQASRLTGVSPHGIRARCRRGWSAAIRSDSGEWRISATALDERLRR